MAYSQCHRLCAQLTRVLVLRFMPVPDVICTHCSYTGDNVCIFPLLLTFAGQDARTENPFCSRGVTGTDYPRFVL